VRMEAREIECKIPLSEIDFLLKDWWRIIFEHGRVFLELSWEEDKDTINGKLGDGFILLDKEKQGTFKNSDDGGLSQLLEKFKGSGIIETSGEETDDHDIYKYNKGKKVKGKVVFEE